MPHIFINNMNEEVLPLFTHEVSEALAQVIDCPLDWLHFYLQSKITYTENKLNKQVCFVEVKYFKRDLKTQEAIVSIIDNALTILDYNERVITFTELQKELYYENNEQF